MSKPKRRYRLIFVDAKVKAEVSKGFKSFDGRLLYVFTGKFVKLSDTTLLLCYEITETNY